MEPAADLAPLCVPIEIRRADAPFGGFTERNAPLPRWFRLGLGLGLDRIRLRSPLPDELRGRPLRVRLHLPPPTAQAEGLQEHWDGELSLLATAGEVIVKADSDEERAEARLLLLQNLLPADRTRIEDYIRMRLLSAE
jgi:hypothetical protein